MLGINRRLPNVSNKGRMNQKFMGNQNAPAGFLENYQTV